MLPAQQSFCVENWAGAGCARTVATRVELRTPGAAADTGDDMACTGSGGGHCGTRLGAVRWPMTLEGAACSSTWRVLTSPGTHLAALAGLLQLLGAPNCNSVLLAARRETGGRMGGCLLAAGAYMSAGAAARYPAGAFTGSPHANL